MEIMVQDYLAYLIYSITIQDFLLKVLVICKIIHLEAGLIEEE